MQQRWAEFLHGSTVEHGVQLYANRDELARSVAAFLCAGVKRGQSGIAVVVPEHWEAIVARMEERGCDVDGARASELLVVAGAEEVLASVLEDGEPSAELFDREVGALLDRAAAASGRDPRVFGEMVDVLCRAGRRDAAVALEGLWNDLGRRRRFSLLCGYRVDVFDPREQATLLPHVCAAHSHVLPAGNYARLAGAVDRALDEVLGSRAASDVYRAVARERDDVRVPMAQLILMWLSTNRAEVADRVLSAARAHYAAT